MEFTNLLGQIRPLAAGVPEGQSLIMMFLVYGVLIAALYFFFFRPQNKKKKKEADMKKNAQVGDEITTIGGISGRIIAVKSESEKKEGDSVIIETGSDKTKIRVKRWAIGSVDTIYEDEE